MLVHLKARLATSEGVFQWTDKRCLGGQEGPYVCVSMERQALSVGAGGAICVCKITEAGGG